MQDVRSPYVRFSRPQTYDATPKRLVCGAFSGERRQSVTPNQSVIDRPDSVTRRPDDDMRNVASDIVKLLQVSETGGSTAVGSTKGD